LAFLSSLRSKPGAKGCGIGSRIGGGGAMRSRASARQPANSLASSGAPILARKPNAAPFHQHEPRRIGQCRAIAARRHAGKRLADQPQARHVALVVAKHARAGGASVTRPASGGAPFRIAGPSSLQPNTAPG
jgi:hypothetical protein